MVYARFNPLDKRCGINLDEIDPAKWSLLEAATDDYIAASQDRFQQLADILVAPKPVSGRPFLLDVYKRLAWLFTWIPVQGESACRPAGLLMHHQVCNLC